MQTTSLFIILLLGFVQLTLSREIVNNDQNENKPDDVQSMPSSSPLNKQTVATQCISKEYLLNAIKRNTRASISRPYFQYWRPARDNIRYPNKNSLAFSPRLGKRDVEPTNEVNIFDSNALNDLEELGIKVIYEDSSKICFTVPNYNDLIGTVLGKIDLSRRDQNEQDNEEVQDRQFIGKHPVLFRYRLG